MEPIRIAGDFSRPAVSFDAASGVLELSGRSVPERGAEFYGPLLEWIVRYAKSPVVQTTFNLKMEYCNSTTSRYIMDMLVKMEEMHKQGCKVTINWYYEEEDETIYDLGMSYKKPLVLPFNLVEVPSEDDE